MNHKEKTCDACSAIPDKLKKVDVLTEQGYRTIQFCEPCFHLAKESGLIRK